MVQFAYNLHDRGSDDIYATSIQYFAVIWNLHKHNICHITRLIFTTQNEAERVESHQSLIVVHVTVGSFDKNKYIFTDIKLFFNHISHTNSL